MSLILSIETSSKNCSVSLSKDGFLLDVIEKITDSEVRNLVKSLIGVKE